MAQLLYFAGLVDQLGKASEQIELPPGIADVRGLLAWLRTRGGPWEQHLADPAVRVVVNKQFAQLTTPVSDAETIAFIPLRV